MSWGAIFAGSFVVVAVMSSLLMLGAGIGLVSAPAASSGEGLAKGLGIGSLGWLILSAAVSFYAGGWVTSRLNRSGIVSDGVIHSAVTWAFATCAFIFIVTTAVGGALGSLAGAMGSAAGAAAREGTEAAQRAEPGAIERVQEQAGRAIEQARQNAPTREQAIQKAETGAQVAGAAGIGGFILMLIEALACMAGGRAGARMLRPRIVTSHRSRETVAS